LRQQRANLEDVRRSARRQQRPNLIDGGGALASCKTHAMIAARAALSIGKPALRENRLASAWLAGYVTSIADFSQDAAA